MDVTPHRKFFRRFLVVWIAAVIILLAIFAIFFSPLSPFHYCSQVGCRDTLELTLSNEPNTPYTILLTSSTGDTRLVTCIPGEASASTDMSVVCRPGIVNIYGYTPTTVSVTVSWQGGYYDITGAPRYVSFRPNGLFCPPSCRLGKLSVVLP